MTFISQAYAQQTPAPAAAGAVPPETSVLGSLFPLVLIFIVFYFMLIRPQQKKFKAFQEMVGGLKKGDKVLTGGGLLGTITKIDGDVLHVEIAPEVVVKVMKNTISSVNNENAKPKADTAKEISKKATANDN